MRGKKTLKIAAGIVGIALIVFVLIVTNSLVGNPISSFKAKSAAKKHVERYYSHLDLEIGKPVYNFKNGEYYIMTDSKSSMDTKFTMTYRNKQIDDDYNFAVLGKSNTISRLSKEYGSYIKALLEKERGFYIDNHSYVSYDKDIYENPGDLIELDMKFDRRLPIETEVNISINVEDLSPDKVAELMEDVHRVFLDDGCIFSEYNFSGGDGGYGINVYNVKPSQIESGNLVDILKKAGENESGEHEGVTVFEKSIDK